jgi:hypothetical protein
MRSRRKTGEKRLKLLDDLIVSSKFQNSFEHEGFGKPPPALGTRGFR